ncbi:MAG: NADH-quinone oxidoreductase subunit A [Armatimonadota bacterium]|nr:NADH-quinone oxidoreductase subunit A [Armatimonadota bacterium]MCX7776991.1 NADH-quinone oxidoreductase subunit A [Armatimonadota bacterium]MDW8024825.1 NADH-quinone oxidoreductase subunit A [Armatimonadota bacterium]
MHFAADYWYVALFALMGVIFIFVALFLAWLIRPHNPTPDKLMPYECSVRPVGEARVQFRIIFYLVALLFLAFDVEVVFLFPWAVVLRELGSIGLGLLAWFDMMLFIGILLLAWLYAYRKGMLDW